jgi:putative oxidoreductase
LKKEKAMLSALFTTDPDWTQTIVRSILGVVFFAHGAQKLLGWFGGPGLKATIGAMHRELGLPAPLAFLTVAAQFFCGLGLMAGLLGRVAAAGIGIIMLVAIVMVHGRNGLFLDWFGDHKRHGYEYHLLAIGLAAVIIVRGSGAASLDRLLFS